MSRTCSSFPLMPRMHRHLHGHSCEDSRSSFSFRPHRTHWHLKLRSSNSKTAGEAGCIAMQPAHHAQTRVLAFEQASPASPAAASRAASVQRASRCPPPPPAAVRARSERSPKCAPPRRSALAVGQGLKPGICPRLSRASRVHLCNDQLEVESLTYMVSQP